MTFSCYPDESWELVPVAGQECLGWLACLTGDGPLCLTVPRSTSPSPAQAPCSVNYGKSINPSFTVVIEGYHISASCTPAREPPCTCSSPRDRHRRHSLSSSGPRAAWGTRCSLARAREQTGCAPSPKQMSKLCLKTPHKMLDWEELWKNRLRMGVWFFLSLFFYPPRRSGSDH